MFIIEGELIMNIDRMAIHNTSQGQINKFNISVEANATRQEIINKTVVRAIKFVKKGSLTEVIDVNKLCQKATTVTEYVDIVDAEGRLFCVNKRISTLSWLKNVPLANDCHSCNVLLMRANNGVILSTVKDIMPEEPLLMWFAEDILTILNIPFLKPTNIQDHYRYICHMCTRIFEYPNPLKLHIALNCNRLDNDYIWILLARNFNNFSNVSLTHMQTTFNFRLTSSVPLTSTSKTSLILRNIMSKNLSPTNSSSKSSSDQQSSVLSNQLSPNSLNTQISPRISPNQLSTHNQMSTIGESSNRQSAFTLYERRRDANAKRENQEQTLSYNVGLTEVPLKPYEDAAQIETIMSNIGRSLRGHVCIYCGKTYSRKYGLKIHIRTHTGYKPLKCKYCARSFGDPSNLNKHVRLHANGDNPYKCDLCGKILVRRRDLERHIKSRHRENTENIVTSSEIK